jgi:hypothetical protein
MALAVLLNSLLVFSLFQLFSSHFSFFIFSKAEFLDVIGTQVLRVFLLVIHSHLYYGIPPPPRAKWFETVLYNVDVVYGNFKSENSKDCAQPDLKKMYFHEFGFSSQFPIFLSLFLLSATLFLFQVLSSRFMLDYNSEPIDS